MTVEKIVTEVQNRGFAQVEAALTSVECINLIKLLPQQVKGGVRKLLTLTHIANLAQHPNILASVHSVLGDHAVPFRATLFDKHRHANWLVPWHQDVVIPVEQRIEFQDWGPWSHKAGVLYVQPPVAIMEQILAVRVHLDPCRSENGALQILPGTHRGGRLAPEQIATFRQAIPAEVCPGQAGDLVLMRPLLVHSSAKVTVNGHRRIIHFEYIAQPLSAPYPKLVLA